MKISEAWESYTWEPEPPCSTRLLEPRETPHLTAKSRVKQSQKERERNGKKIEIETIMYECTPCLVAEKVWEKEMKKRNKELKVFDLLQGL